MNLETHKYIKYKSKYLKIIKGGGKIIKEIYFIKYGQTLWNQLGKTQGFEADIELNKNGINDATITGKYLKQFRFLDKQFDCIISSPMLRCKKTAEIIATELSFDKKIIFDDNI